MFPTPIEKRPLWYNVAYRMTVPVALFFWLIPLLAVMLTSLRSIEDINAGNYWGMPSEILLIENYMEVFTSTPMLQYLINTLMISIPAAAGAVVIATLAGFSLAKYSFKGNVLLFALFVAGNFIPFQILMIPVRDLTIKLGLYDTKTGIVLFHIAFQSGFCTLFMRNFIKGIPNELMEAARVEGVKEWKIFLFVIVPLVRPAIAALSVLVFTFIWNDFFWSLVLAQSDSVRPVTAGLNSLRGQWLASWQLISAGSIVAALPPSLLFFFMQKHFIAGLTLGANKG